MRQLFKALLLFVLRPSVRVPRLSISGSFYKREEEYLEEQPEPRRKE